MAFRKCPRCELNYITDGEKLCSVCRREVKGEPDRNSMPELCSECGERPVVPGSEYCLLCLKELSRRSAASTQGESEEGTVDASALDIGMVSSMDEIQIDDVGDDIPPREFDEMESAFGSDDDEDEDEDDEDDDEPVSSRKRSRRDADAGI
ncbi:MAG: hypothetical protein ACI4L8_04860 [Candidatus Fimadaptatus sp.]